MRKIIGLMLIFGVICPFLGGIRNQMWMYTSSAHWVTYFLALSSVMLLGMMLIIKGDRERDLVKLDM